jgi:hypothetical protein
LLADATSILSFSASPNVELRKWTELILAKRATLAGSYALSNPSESNNSMALAAFRSWSKLWEGRPGQGALISSEDQSGLSYRGIWKLYYEFLSRILRTGSPYSVEASSRDPNVAADIRFKLRAEILRVQTTYEGLLMNELKFPKADEGNEEIEKWCNEVMQNWRILCGDEWQDDDLGSGGKEAVGRGVLDVGSPLQPWLLVISQCFADSISGSHKILSFNTDSTTFIYSTSCPSRIRPCIQSIRYLSEHCSKRKIP